MADNAKHLLLVDDEAALREAIAERLADHGFVVEQAASGEDAMARLADTKEAREQVAFADQIILNKIDLVSTDDLAAVERVMGEINAAGLRKVALVSTQGGET